MPGMTVPARKLVAGGELARMDLGRCELVAPADVADLLARCNKA